MTSDCGSVTGSLCHGVSRLVWLLPRHVNPNPLSVTSVPKFALAMTLAHGAGSLASGSQIDRIFAPIFGEATQPVEVREFEKRQRDGRLLRAAAGSNKRRLFRTLSGDRELLLQRAAAAAQNHAGSGQKQVELSLGQIAPIEQKHSAPLIIAGVSQMGVDLTL